MNKNYTLTCKEDTETLINYLTKFERYITDKNYSTLEYLAECFMCELRDILANSKQVS
jgi:hypothetical protein